MINDTVPQGSDINYISPLRFWVQKVLPLVWDDSLSYYELLSKVVFKLNEVIEIVNPLGAGLQETIKQIMDQYKDDWEVELKAFEDQITAQVNQNNIALNNRINSLTSSVNEQIAQNKKATDNQIEALTAQLMKEIATISASVATTDQANRLWTKALFQDYINNLPKEYPPITDPSDGKLEDIQTVVNHMWDSMRPEALTAAEYDALNLTAQDYDNYQLTAQQYDNYGKILLKPEGN